MRPHQGDLLRLQLQNLLLHVVHTADEEFKLRLLAQIMLLNVMQLSLMKLLSWHDSVGLGCGYAR